MCVSPASSAFSDWWEFCFHWKAGGVITVDRTNMLKKLERKAMLTKKQISQARRRLPSRYYDPQCGIISDLPQRKSQGRQMASKKDSLFLLGKIGFLPLWHGKKEEISLCMKHEAEMSNAKVYLYTLWKTWQWDRVYLLQLMPYGIENGLFNLEVTSRER